MVTIIVVAVIAYIISGIAIHRRYLQLKSINSIVNGWHVDPEVQEMLARLGSDYNEDGVPYWDAKGDINETTSN